MPSTTDSLSVLRPLRVLINTRCAYIYVRVCLQRAMPAQSASGSGTPSALSARSAAANVDAFESVNRATTWSKSVSGRSGFARATSPAAAADARSSHKAVNPASAWPGPPSAVARIAPASSVCH